MLNINDFKYKQIIFVNLREGEKIRVENDNLVIEDKSGKIKLNCTFYRLFVLYVVGNFSLTSNLIEKSKKFGFSIIIMSYSFRFITVINNGLVGNTLLHSKQYSLNTNDVGKMIVITKLKSQKYIVDNTSTINNQTLSSYIESYIACLENLENPDLNTIMAFEGLVAKQYFKNIFGDDSCKWIKRMPRTKIDPINATLDIGYTILFSFIESLLSIYDFDVYVGVLHRQFYKRKSLVCDMVEPFRYIIDYETRKNRNLKIFKDDDFEVKQNCYRLKKDKTSLYMKSYITVILKNKEMIFRFIQSYYRWFMKGCIINQFPEVMHNVDG